MTPIFLYGTLLDREHLSIVAGADVPARAARLDGHGVFHAGEAFYPCIAEDEGHIDGLLVEAGPARARLDFYEGGYGYSLKPVTVETEDGPVAAEVYWPGADVPAPGAPWSLEAWKAKWGALTLLAAREAMACFGQITPDELANRMPTMRARAQSRLLAEVDPTPHPLSDPPAGDVEIVQEVAPYTGFFAVKEFDLSHPTFDGGRSPVVKRAAFLSGDAVVLLPYDPVRDRVHLIEQFRAGPLGRGDPQTFLMEAIAGRIDPGETPEEAARREAQEEGGLTLKSLHLASKSYPSPGAVSEFLHIYIGIADLPDDVAETGGVASEDEDIRTHLVAYERFEKLLDECAFRVGPLELAAHWLVRHRSRLRNGA